MLIMKTTATTILFLLLTLMSFAQNECQIINGSFETWEDFTEDFDESGTLPEGTIMLPEGYLGLFRLIFSALEDLFSVFGGEELIEQSSMFFGLYQSTDASDGNFSLQMQADENFPFVDAFTGLECIDVELPSSFNFDLKHVGGGADTFSLFGTFSEESTLALDEYGLQDAGAFFVIDSITMVGDTEWTSFNIPVVDNMNGISPDSVVLFMFMSSNEDSLSNGVESYYLIDNMSFNSETVLPLSTTSLGGEFNNTHNDIQWSIVNDHSSNNYIIERSHESIEDWKEIATINSNSNGANIYNYEDYDIHNPGYYYYRIKKVDLNGSESTSSTIQIYVSIINNFKIVSYPNPARDELNIELYLEEDSKNIKSQLISADGRVYGLGFNIPTDISVGYHNFNIDTSQLPSGIYQLVVKSEFTEVKEKIIIINR